MAELNEHVAYLSQEVGPRPAGTEEEQRAALYISEQLSAESGLTTAMEDFQCNPDSSLPRALCCAVAVLVTLLATIVGMLAIPAIVIAFLCAGLVFAEVFDKPVLSRLLNRGVSQNVVAKYVPAKSPTRSSRRRKVIVVANYDSGKVRRDLTGPAPAVLPVLYWAELAALLLMPVLLIIRTALSPDGGVLLVFNVLLALAMVVAVLPVVSFVFEKLANYNEGANCNASGVAVLLEVASRVAAARDLPDSAEPIIHGAAAADAEGLIPEGAEISYQAGNTADDLGSSMESAAERLAAAKAAVAALSGKPVTNTAAETAAPVSAADASESTLDEKHSSDEGVDVPAGPVIAAAPLASEAPAVGHHEVPEWFKKGQEQAKKPTKEKPVQRSRYATALEKAEEEINAREESERRNADELSERMRVMRASVRAASTAAGATPTGVISEAAPESSPAEAQSDASNNEAAPIAPSELPEKEAPSVSADELPNPAKRPAVPALADIPAIASEADESEKPARAIAVPSPLPQVTEDPDVMVRDGQRPLTGATVAAPPIDLSDLASPAPSEGDSSSARRVVVPSVGEVKEEDIPPVSAHPSRRRRAITLPDIGISQELPRISMDDRQQAAPLAEERPERDGRVHDLSSVIPSVASPSPEPSAAPATNEAALLDALPSLNRTTATADPGLSGSINLAGAFSPMGATGVAAPIGDELLENATEEDLYIEDVDDSAYVEQITETGAMAGPGYVEMPKSRFGGLFGKLRRKKREEPSTPQEWLEVEEGFDAREVGAARGGWESFREEEESYTPEDTYDDLGETTAFSADFEDEVADGDFPPPRTMGRRSRRFEGGAFSRDRLDGEYDEGEGAGDAASSDVSSVFAEGLPADFVFEPVPAVEAIEQFHSDRIDIEVWFVALGSELAGNGGMKAFMAAHEADLKGSIIVELEAMGAGELTLIDKEGSYLPKKASSRMKRLVRKAGQATGLKVPEATMEWRNSASAYALRHGQQALHLAGMDGRKPAFFAEEDDVIENIDNDMLALNSDFVMEVLKHI